MAEIQINPGEQYPVVRVLQDPNDLDTHYVQAVIKKASDNSTLKTINLTDKGNRIFIGTWDVPNPPYPLRVFIVTTVYDDAGYSSINGNYAQVSDNALVDQRWSMALGSGGGSGGSVDYKKIAALIAAALKNFASELPPPKVNIKPQAIDFEPLAQSLVASFAGLLGGLPQPEKVDLSPLGKQLEGLLNELRARPQFQKTDLSTLHQLVTDAATIIVDEVRKVNSNIEVSIPDIRDEVSRAIAARVGEHLKGGVEMRLGIAGPQEKKPGAEAPQPTDRFKKLLVPMKSVKQ